MEISLWSPISFSILSVVSNAFRKYMKAMPLDNIWMLQCSQSKQYKKTAQHYYFHMTEHTYTVYYTRLKMSMFAKLRIVLESDSLSEWWLFKMFAGAAVMFVEHFWSEYPAIIHQRSRIFVFIAIAIVTVILIVIVRCTAELRWERSVSSFIHGGKYLKVVK